MPEYIEPEVVKEPVEIDYDTEISMSCNEDDLDEHETKSLKSMGTHKMLSEFTKSNKNLESPELFRLKAKMRMTSSSKKFAIVLDEENNLVDQSQNNSSIKKASRSAKAARIALSPEQAEATKDLPFVDPNSMAYTNVVLEDKINEH